MGRRKPLAYSASRKERAPRGRKARFDGEAAVGGEHPPPLAPSGPPTRS